MVDLKKDIIDRISSLYVLAFAVLFLILGSFLLYSNRKPIGYSEVIGTILNSSVSEGQVKCHVQYSVDWKTYQTTVTIPDSQKNYDGKRIRLFYKQGNPGTAIYRKRHPVPGAIALTIGILAGTGYLLCTLANQVEKKRFRELEEDGEVYPCKVKTVKEDKGIKGFLDRLGLENPFRTFVFQFEDIDGETHNLVCHQMGIRKDGRFVAGELGHNILRELRKREYDAYVSIDFSEYYIDL